MGTPIVPQHDSVACSSQDMNFLKNNQTPGWGHPGAQ